jgi:hypothetical protein
MLLILLILISGWFAYLKTKENKGMKILSAVSAVCVTTLGSILIMAVIVGQAPSTIEFYEKGKFELVAIKDDSFTVGHFFLASGSFGPEFIYYFYYKMADGGIKMGSLPVNQVRVFEEERSDAYIMQIGKKTKANREYKISNQWIVPTFLYGLLENDDYEWRVVVPKDTIKRNFQLDLNFRK